MGRINVTFTIFEELRAPTVVFTLCNTGWFGDGGRGLEVKGCAAQCCSKCWLNKNCVGDGLVH